MTAGERAFNVIVAFIRRNLRGTAPGQPAHLTHKKLLTIVLSEVDRSTSFFETSPGSPDVEGCDGRLKTGRLFKGEADRERIFIPAITVDQITEIQLLTKGRESQPIQLDAELPLLSPEPSRWDSVEIAYPEEQKTFIKRPLFRMNSFGSANMGKTWVQFIVSKLPPHGVRLVNRVSTDRQTPEVSGAHIE